VTDPARRRLPILALVGPGLLVAATGVGAGDLATGALAGSRIGLAVLWAVVLGAFLKFVLTEGLARWQIATGETVLGGALRRFGTPAKLLFAAYFLLWSFFVGSALVSACGVTAHALFPVFEAATTGKQVFGVVASLLGIVLVRVGGYRLFEKVMSVTVGVMFVTVVVTAVLLKPDVGAFLRGLAIPSIPEAGGEGLAWTVALMGGVGGTLTILCYGYWIREEGRDGPEDMGTARIDLAIGYTVTAVFGLAMVVIGNTIEATGKGAGLVVSLGERLAEPLGPVGCWAFLIGAFGAVFSSLLGVWQSVPYLFADFLRVGAGREGSVETTSRPYRLYLYALGLVPLAGLFFSFRAIQKYYAILGALFIPMLALALLVMNGRRDWIGERFRNRPLTGVVLLAAMGLFLYFGYIQLRRIFG
jgi:Mn2+/Fe2+ NRAMP family transporter